MDILNPSIQNTPYFQPRLSISSSNSSIQSSRKSPFLKFHKPYSKLPIISPFPLYSSFSRSRRFQISAHFSRQTGYRRNSLREKLTGIKQVRDSPLIYKPSPDFENPVDKFDNIPAEPLPEQIPVVLDNDVIKDGDTESSMPSDESDSLDKLRKESVLLKQLESWADQYKADSEFWGVGSNPIFTVFQDSNGKVERVDVNKDEILIRSGIVPSLYKKSGSEDFKEVDSKILRARSIAKETEIGKYVFNNSSVAKFVVNSSRKVGFVEGIKEMAARLPLNSRTSRIGIAVLCGSFVLLTLKWFFSTRKKAKKYTRSQRDMLARKFMARMEKENLVKGSGEVVQDFEKPKMESIGRPPIQKQEIIDNIIDIEVLKDQESVDLNNKIEEIRVMARSAREIEKKESLQGQVEDDETENKLLDDNDDQEEKDDVLVVNVSNEKEAIVANESEKMVVEVANDSGERKSDLKEENVLNILEKNEARKPSRKEKMKGREKPRVIRSVKESREYLSRKRKENNQESRSETVAQEVDSVSISENEEESEVKSKLLNSNAIPSSSLDDGNIEANFNGKRTYTNLDESEAIEKKIGVGFEKTNQESQFEKNTEKETFVENKFPISKDSTTDNNQIDATLNEGNKVEGKVDETEAMAKKIGVGSENNGKESQFRKSVEALVDSILSEVTEKDSDVRVPNPNGVRDSSTDKDDNKVESNEESWAEKNLDEFEPMAKMIGLGFKENFEIAKEKKNSMLGSNIETIKPLLDVDGELELEWMKDEKLLEIVFQVRENELLGRDPFYLLDAEDKDAFFKGLEKKVEKMNEHLQPLHDYLHSNIENLDYGSAGISIYDTPDKIYPRWKGPPIESTPEFLKDYAEVKNSLVSQNLEKHNNSKSNKPVANTPTTSKTTTATKKTANKAVKTPKTVIEGSDGSEKAGKKTGKEYWAHTKKYTRGFIEAYNAQQDPEVKAVMRTIGQDLDRWITDEEIEAAAKSRVSLSEKRKQDIEAKLHKFKTEINTYGPQAVVNKYREYEDEEEEVDYFWWLDLPYIMCIELHTKEDGVEGTGFYSLEMAAELELKPKQYHVIGFQDVADCKNLAYIIQSHMEMEGTGNAFVVARPPKEAYREAKASGYGVTVIRKGEIEMNVDQTLGELEEKIAEIGTKMYEDKIQKGRSVDINSVMKGILGEDKKTENKKKQGKPKSTTLKEKVKLLMELDQKLQKRLKNIKSKDE